MSDYTGSNTPIDIRNLWHMAANSLTASWRVQHQNPLDQRENTKAY